MAEIRLLLANLVYHFDMEVVAEDKRWLDACRVFIGWEKIPFRFELSPRIKGTSHVNETELVGTETRQLLSVSKVMTYANEMPLATDFNTLPGEKQRIEVHVLEVLDEDIVETRRHDILPQKFCPGKSSDIKVQMYPIGLRKTRS
jgi:hypothetical protein